MRSECIRFLQRISDRVLGTPNGILELAFELVRPAVSLQFSVACRLADLLYNTVDFRRRSDDLILVNDYLLLIVITREKIDKLTLCAPGRGLTQVNSGRGHC